MKPTQNPTTTPVPVPVRTPAALLRAAATYLCRYGWIKHDFFDLHSRELFPAACALGAINACAHGRPILTCTVVEDGLDLDETSELAITAMRVFAAYLDSDYADGRKDTSAIDIVSGYNDHNLTTVDEVVAFLNEAADDWDKTHPVGGAR